MVIKQDVLLNEIAEKSNMDFVYVRLIFETAEECIRNHLKSANETENVTVKPFKGLSITGEYIPEREIHTYDDIVCKERVWAKPKISRYYNKKLNGFI